MISRYLKELPILRSFRFALRPFKRIYLHIKAKAVKHEIRKRSKYSFFKIQQLACDIPMQMTPEIHTPNDFYGIATILKKYADFSLDYSIKASIEHGVYYSDYYWVADTEAPFSTMFCTSRHRKNILAKVTEKVIYAIGPAIAYADKFYLHDELYRAGQTLLVFPTHSTHWIDVTYDVTKFCRYLHSLKGKFETIRVCLYWKDILRGVQKTYLESGFECITAGHIYDPNFLNRLRSIIEMSTMTLSNGLGTHLGYCIYLGKPHYLMPEEVSYDTAPFVHDEAIARLKKYEQDTDQQKFYELFGNFQDSIAPAQKEIVEKYWGISEIKSKSQMANLIATAQKQYENDQIGA